MLCRQARAIKGKAIFGSRENENPHTIRDIEEDIKDMIEAGEKESDMTAFIDYMQEHGNIDQKLAKEAKAKLGEWLRKYG